MDERGLTECTVRDGRIDTGYEQFRLLVLFGLLFVCAKSGLFDPLAMVIPLVFVRPVITVYEFFRKKEDKKA